MPLCGIPHKRHTFASTSLAEGVPISEVSRWLGHKSITTTVDLYGHLVPEASGRACDALDERSLGGDVPQSAPAPTAEYQSPAAGQRHDEGRVGL